jgi:amino acid adenylation domain-containing protein/non-ribosomal peptide synthase protein (TIGR01720 family)
MSSVTDPNDQIRTALLDVLGQVFGVEPSAIDPQAQFLEMGVDSLAMLRLSQIVQDGFGVKIPFRKMLEEVSTIDALTGYIAQELSSDSGNEAATPRTADYLLNLRKWAVEQTDGFESATPTPPHNHRQTEETLNVISGAAPASPSDNHPGLLGEVLTPDEAALADGAALERIFAQQIQIMTQQMAQQTQVMSAQLDLLRRYGRVTALPSAATTAPSEKAEAPLATAPIASAVAKGLPARTTAAAHNAEPGRKVESEVFVPYKPIRVEKGNRLTERQRQHLESLVERITRKTQGSKRLTQTYRPYLADNRSSAGFHHLWKEMCYPLVVERGQGARVYDVDGNEYIDLTMGFGALMFGHSPDFLVKAMQEAVTNGVRLGGQSDIVGQTAKLICELTGVERVAFCNSGTEAVMGALRLARTVTGRSKIAIFEGSYHGTFDGVMVRPGGRKADGQIEALPMAPGVPRHMIENVLLLGYDDDEALAAIEAHARDLAAVIIEPPRSRRPDVQPREFLHKLREITRRAGIALIFDEVVTGFRFHPGGVQALFEVQADLVAYGKAIGNGVPIGVVAGKAAFMDAVDGGMWNYGDDSYPSAETTFFAGTYFKNPLVVAAVRSILNHIKETGPQLYEDLNARAQRLGNALKEYFERESVPIQILQVGSLFRFQLPPRQSLLDLFYYHLLEKGVYICETRNCFFSTAHTDQDVDHILRAVKETIEEMREGGFFPDRTSSGPGRNSSIQDTPGGPPPLAIPTNSFGVAAATALAPATERPQVAASGLPLTEAQKQLWFLAQLGEEASVAYNLSLTLELRGAFHYDHMRRCFQAVVDNHEALRITFSPDGERQYVNPVVPVELSLIDVSTLQQPEQRESAGRRRVAAFAKQPFDLINGPLIRGCVVKLASDFHLLAVTTHHTVTDGGAFGVLLRELSQRYTSACRGEQPVISPPFQFSQFVQWEAGHLAGDNLHQMEQYWLGQFADPPLPLDLPTDRQRPALQSYAGARESFSLGPELSAKLLQFSARQGSTPFMLLLSAVNLLLHRLSGQDDIVVGIPVAGQTSFGGPLIGYCLNVLPIRSRIGEAMSFNEYLDSAKKALLDAYEHQAYPFNLLVKKLKIPRDPSRAPLITVMFNLDRVTSQPQFEGLQVNLTQNTTDTAQFDLDINVKQTKDDFHFDCDYSASLFDRATIQRWLSHLENLLAEIASRPAEQPGQLRLLNDAERQQILFDWNSTSATYPKQTSMARLFEEQVARTPDNVAVSCADRRLTYAELNRRANRLARILLRAGVGPEVVVALLAERDIEMLIAILAVFKAGGAYLPLDPNHPPQRLAQLLEQGKVGLALTTREFEDRLENAASGFSEAAKPTILILEESVREAQREENLPLRAEAENLAYVIFTSGSTGTPKGAMVVQQGMVNHLYAKISDLRLVAGDVVAQTASQCFDISVWQFLAALLVGGQVCILPDEVAHDSREMMKEVDRRGVTILEVVPSLLQEVLSDAEADEAWRMGRGELRWLLVTGEAVAPEMCRRWLGRYPGAPIMNAYGPTECSDDVTHYVINQEISADMWNVPIGRPIANTWLFILDEYSEPLPVGVRGELYVGGDGVGRGYLERADMTAERFVPNPFGGRSGERLYRTGDVARYLPDGQIEFLGRLDHQVKLRGFRIELGEIEHALSRRAGVRHSIAVVREDAPGEKRIVAYYVAGEVGTDNGEAPGADELRGYLQGQLPDYMIPSAFVLLTEFPLTPSGKIDRKALPAPEGAWVSGVEYEAPRTELEAILAEAWQEALHVELVGVRDNFFELGGDSILSMRVVARARARGVELSPAEMFRHQSVAELAAAIQARRGQTPAHLSGTVPLTPAQRWFFGLNQPAPQHFNQAVMLELSPKIKPAILAQVVEELVARHDALRVRFNNEGGQWRQVIVGPERVSAFTTQDLSAIPVAGQVEAIETLAEEIQASLNLSEGPLFRAVYIKLGARQSSRLLLVAHHLAVDLSSWRILLEEFQVAYQQLSREKPLMAPPPSASFGRWAQKLSEWADSEESLSEANYWLDQSRATAAPLPIDIDGGLNVESSVGALITTLSEQDTRALLYEATKAFRVAPNEVLLTALALAGTRWSGQDKFLVDIEGHGREDLFPDIDLSRTVGWFTAIYPALLDLGEAGTALEALKLVKKQVRAIPRGGIGYGALKYLSHRDDIAAGLQAQPQAEVSFNYIGPTAAAKQTKGSIRLAKESLGRLVSEHNSRPYRLMVSGQVENQRLIVHWNYSKNVHRDETIRELAGYFEEALQDLLAGCEQKAEGLYTPSDFPNANLNQNELDEFLSTLA